MASPAVHEHAPSKSSRRRLSQALFLLAMLLVGLLSAVFGLARGAARGGGGGGEWEAGRIFVPSLRQEAERNAHRTLFLLPGIETRCHWQYNYVCKFWFFVRCFVLRAFPRVQLLAGGEEAVAQLRRRARHGDIALVAWRSRKHDEQPSNLAALLRWQRGGGAAPRLRVGVLHVANEVNRSAWGWYGEPDFVVRNYWVRDLPAHAAYIPLGPQLPNACAPWSSDGDRWARAGAAPPCSCGAARLARASARRYLWHFGGSLRKRRARLVKLLRASAALRARGYLAVSRSFGGDGVFGSGGGDNPKTEYLRSIAQSAFVFAPCGNAMETHRIYEAVALGAIPVVENCDAEVSHFFPLRELLIDGDVENMVRFVERVGRSAHDVDALQQRVQRWWRQYAAEIGVNVSRTATRHVARAQRRSP